MREKRAGVVVFEAIDITQEQFDQPIFWLLAALLAFMPAAFGAWDPWVESIALAGACGLAVILGLKLAKRPDVGFVWSWTYLPIALFFLYAAIQLMPLPAAWVQAISPKTVTTNHWLLGDLPNAAERLTHLRLNFYQEGAWHDLRNIAAVTCVFVVVINVFRRSEQIIQLLWVIAWVGTGEGLLAILQTLTGAKGVYWYFPLWGDARPEAGTFPNHNCFAQFMNLGTGACVGLLLLKIDRTFRRHDYSPAEVLEKLNSPDFRSAWILTAMLAISIASVFLSLSRGGMLSIAAAGILVGILLAVRGGARGMGIGGWIAGVILVAVFSLVMAGGANLVQGRIARIGNPDDRFDRLQLTRDTLRAWKDYPAVGMGLGSFRFTFQSYDRSNVSAVASHAEDEYVQLLEETGVVGAAIVGSFLLLIVANFLRARARGRKKSDRDGERIEAVQTEQPAMSRESPRQDDVGAGDDSHRSGEPHRPGGPHHRQTKHAASPASSLSLGLCFGLVAILVQSAADFGQHCVSIATLTSIFCALLVNLARLRRQERGSEGPSKVVRGWRSVRIGALAVVVAISTYLLWQSNEVRMATAAYEQASKLAGQLAGGGWQGDQGDFTDMNRAGDESVRLRPNDIRFRYWRAVNRWYTISDVHDPVTGDVILDDAKTRILREVADDLQAARWICPTYGALYAQLGQWEQNFLGQPAQGAHHIRLAYELAPGDPTVCFVLATLEAELQDWPHSVTHFQRAAELDPTMFNDAVDLYVSYFKRPEAAVQLADKDVEQLRLVSRKLRALGKDASAGPTTGPATRPADEQAALEADARADDLIRAAADRPNASAEILGEMGLLSAQRGDFKGAVYYLGRALIPNYGEQDWRLVYAQSLAKLGRKQEAIHQAEIILAARPQMSEAQDLIDQLTPPTTQTLDDLLR